MIPKRSSVLFTDFRQVLTNLGFTTFKRGKFWAFEHPELESAFLYRPYRSNERVTLLDLHRTRSDLDNLGILEAASFDDRLSKATA